MSTEEDRSTDASGSARSGAIMDAVAYAAIALLRSRDVISEMPGILRQLGEAIGASRVYVYENVMVDGGPGDIQRFGWAAPGISPDPDDQPVPYLPAHERYIRVLGTGGVIAEPTTEVPPEERVSLERDGILSIAIVPIFVGDAWWGYIGFDDCSEARRWNHEEVSALRVAAETIGAAFERQELDTSLREVERRYRTFIEHAPDIFIYADHPDEDDSTSYVSPQIETILGVTPEQWIEAEGDSLWLKMLHPDDRERVQRQYAEYLNGGPDLDDYRMVREDGQVVWVRDRAKIMRGPDGRAVEWGLIQDVTARRGVEDRLREAETRFQSLVEQIAAVTYMESPEGMVSTTYLSPQIEQLVGFTPEECLADPDFWVHRLHPDDLERCIAETEAAAASVQPYASEYRMIARDGRTVWVHDEEHPVLDEDGEPRYWLGVMVDVTEQREAQQGLHEARERFQVLVEQIPAITFIYPFPSTGIERYISPQVEAVMGYTPEEWTATRASWDETVHPEDRAHLRAVFEHADRTLDPYRCDYRAIARDGRTVWLHEEAHVVRSNEGVPLYWLGVILDISHQRATEELEGALALEKETTAKLRELDQLKDQFLAGVSHDLRTPLASILGFALTLEEGWDDLTDERRREFVRRIATNARKQEALVEDLLDIHRVNRGTVALDRRPVDLGALVAEVAKQADYLEGRPVSVDTVSVVVPVDETKVMRIVENLLTNASHHTPPGTAVWVAVSAEPDGSALVSVEDAGPGLSPEEKERIFEEFVTGADPHERGSPGLGVGLSLVRRFAALHGGRAWVEDRPGGGSAFRVSLPSV